MIGPKRHQQLMELGTVELCTQILYDARNKLYLNMYFLDISSSSLGSEATTAPEIEMDGFVIYYSPDYLFRLYRQGRSYVNRAYLHMVFHCLFCHMDTRGKREREYWDLVCDIVMKSVPNGPYEERIHRPQFTFRRGTYLRLGKEMKVLTVEGIYVTLKEMDLTEKQYNRLTTEFYMGNHTCRYEGGIRKQAQPRQSEWNDNREGIQTQIESMANEPAENMGSLMEQARIESRERYDRKKFLRKFSVPREELQVDEDPFDYIHYTYGLSMCGDMSLIEPLKTKEVYRIEDFVTVIDTPVSCSGELVKRFLEETYTVLCKSETYFKKINIHITQYDDKIQSGEVITSQDEMDAYMRGFTIIEKGGTDFRPAFECVNWLREQEAFRELRGPLYFTDGEGVYPVGRPVYDTVFVSMKEQYTDVSVSSWAIKLMLEPEEIGSPPHTGSGESTVSPTHVGPAESIEMGNSDKHQTSKGRG